MLGDSFIHLFDDGAHSLFDDDGVQYPGNKVSSHFRAVSAVDNNLKVGPIGRLVTSSIGERGELFQGCDCFASLTIGVFRRWSIAPSSGPCVDMRSCFLRLSRLCRRC